MTTDTSDTPLPLPRTLTVRELADLLGVTNVQVIKALMVNGIMADVSKIIDYDTAAVVAVDLGFTPVEAAPAAEPAAPAAVDAPEEVTDDPASLKPRTPVVAMLGHVDHGKTSLLDAIRHTTVTAGEAGGITQRIGAYQATLDDRVITFLDTPGHAAFTQMRARGAEATDIAVLVVAADDGVMPQTREAISHIRAAAVPMIVALTKIDLENANPDRVKRQLSESEVQVEEYGGDIPLVPLSSITGEGVEDLLQTLALVADIHEFQANPDRPADGVVIEAELDRRQGPRTTLLIKRGTLRPGDSLLVGETWGKVKAMFDDRGSRVTTAGPSTPVSVLGMQGIAQAGDPFHVMESERNARDAYQRAKRGRETATLQGQRGTSLDTLFGEIKKGAVKELNLVLKTDVQGSVEPLRQAIEQFTNEEIHVKVIHAAPGAVSESDAHLARAAGGIVLAFNTGIEPGAHKLAATERVEIRSYAVIYKLLEAVEAALSGMLEPVEVEVVDAQAEVLQVFPIRRRGNIAGCRMDEGTARRDQTVRVFRAEAEIGKGAITSLRRFQNDVREVQAGQEFGVAIVGFDAFEVGDRLEFFHSEMQSRVLSGGHITTAPRE